MGILGNVKEILVKINSEWNGKGVEKAEGALKKTTKQVGNLRGMLLGAGLSSLFFGMAMRNATLNIWKTGTKAFQEIMHSVEGTVTQFDLLSGSMQYLKFNVGQALEPLAAQLIPIVDWLSDWVQMNPDVAEQAVKWGLIAGSFLMIGGQLGTMAVGMTSLNTALLSASNNAFSLKSALIAMAGAGYLIDATIAFKEGDIGDGVSSALEAAGLYAILGGNKGTGAALFGLGVAVDLIDAIVDGKGKLTPESLAGLLNKSAPGLFFISGPVGAAALTVGVALSVMSDTFKAQMITTLSQIFGFIVIMVAGLVDIALLPLRTAINQIIGLINVFRVDKIDKLSYTGITESAIDREKELFDQFNEISGTNPSYEYSSDEFVGPKQQNISIQLDRDGTEDFLAGKVLNVTNSSIQ